MIRRVHLRQWRSYEALDLALTPGTTFVVAINGVGKTSLVLGLAWAVFGERSDVDARSCIRAGADSAEVEVELVLLDGRELVIARRIGLRGRPKVTGRLDGTDIDEATMTDLLERSFGVDLGVAARLSFMRDGGHLASRNALNLEEHLYQAFGVADLLATAQLAKTVVKEAEKQRSSVRASTKERLTNRAAVEANIVAGQARLDQQRELDRRLRDQVRDAEQTCRLAERLIIHREQYQQFEQELSGLLHKAHTLVTAERYETSATGAAEAIDWLRMGHQKAELAARQSADAYAEAKGAIAAAIEAIGLLSGDSPRCPTCMRAISDDELAAARAVHDLRLHAATEAAEQHSQAQDEQRARIADMATLITRLESLRSPTPPELMHEIPDLPAAEATHAAALEALQRHNQELGALEEQLRHLQTQIASDDQVAEGEHELQVAYRREAIATAVAEVFQQAIIRITEDLIEPIATEVRWRWKQLFPNGGLTLRADGSIVRMEGGQELAWDTLSGGEQIWARIVTHLLVLATSTTLPFAWFDEPLEHLDPQLRHAVAATLATATQGGNPPQLLVTTYENALARQLAQDTPHASLINVRAAKPDIDPRTNPDEALDEDAATRRAS